MAVSLITPQEVRHQLALRFKARRLLLNLSQAPEILARVQAAITH